VPTLNKILTTVARNVVALIPGMFPSRGSY
jgi:hypothetical protein